MNKLFKLLFLICIFSIFIIKVDAKDSLTILLETEEGNMETNVFPDKNSYEFDRISCNNLDDKTSVTPEFDTSTWKLKLKAVSNEKLDGEFDCEIFFKEQKYNVSVSVTNGTISGDTTKTVNSGNSATFIALPSLNYGLPEVSCTNGASPKISTADESKGMCVGDFGEKLVHEDGSNITKTDCLAYTNVKICSPYEEDSVVDCDGSDPSYNYMADKLNWIDGNEILVENITNDTTCTVNYTRTVYNYAYTITGNDQTFNIPHTGSYKIELWGAQGGTTKTTYPGKYGAYTSGNINLTAGEKLYINVGGSGKKSALSTSAAGGYNGGGIVPAYSGLYTASGGGATDVRITSGNWNNVTSLRSRIMVAAGGSGGSGSSSSYELTQGYAGGISGTQGYTTSGTYQSSSYPSGGGTQTAGGTGYIGRGGAFGYAYQGTLTGYGSGGGGGYYGGAMGFGRSGGGGSSYISGHTGCVAVTSASSSTPKSGCTTGTTTNSCSTHYSGKVFTNTVMIDGVGRKWTNVVGSTTLMPNPSGGTYSSGTGRPGDGYARLTLLSKSS